MDISTILTLNWESMNNPVYIGIVAAVLMLLLIRPAIEIWFKHQWEKTHTEPPPEVWDERGLAINAATFVICFLFAMFKLSFDWGPVAVTSVAAFFAALTEYEVVKNLLRIVKVDISSLKTIG